MCSKIFSHLHPRRWTASPFSSHDGWKSFPFGVAYFQGLLLLKFQGVYPGSPFGPNCLKNSVSPWKLMGSIPVRNQLPNYLVQIDFRGFFIDFYDSTFHIASPQRPKKNGGVMCAHVGHFLVSHLFLRSVRRQKNPPNKMEPENPWIHAPDLRRHQFGKLPLQQGWCSLLWSWHLTLL